MPASKLMYGSILMEVTSMPQLFNIAPKALDITPLPTPLITPPVTKIYFMFDIVGQNAEINVYLLLDSHLKKHVVLWRG